MDPDSDSLSASRLHNSHNPRCCSLAGDLSIRRIKSETGFPSHPGNSPTSSGTLRRADSTQHSAPSNPTASDSDFRKKSPRFAEISHWGSAAATAYARGINDAPKMAALGAFFFVAGSTYAVWGPYSIVAVAILAGSLVLGHRVALELVKRVVPLDHTQRLQAGIVTAALVSVGAYLGAPLSTTHVHEGSTAGIGGRKEVIVSALRGMVLPWLVTLPAAGLLAVTVAVLVARL